MPATATASARNLGTRAEGGVGRGLWFLGKERVCGCGGCGSSGGA